MSTAHVFQTSGQVLAITVLTAFTVPASAGHIADREDHREVVEPHRDHQAHSHSKHGSSGRRVGGHYASRWVPPVYETRYIRCESSYRMLVRHGFYKNHWVPTRYNACRVSRYRHQPVRRHHYRTRIRVSADWRD